MTTLNNGKVLCDCMVDRFHYGRCDICGAETEICDMCEKVKASDCEHYDVLSQGIKEGSVLG